jgi:hypothetical protein
MNRFEYWKEAILSALDESGIVIPIGKADDIARCLIISADQESMAFGTDVIPNPQNREILELKKKLQREKEKTICRTCNGHGTITSSGGTFVSISACHKCNGSGFIYRQ